MKSMCCMNKLAMKSICPVTNRPKALLTITMIDKTIIEQKTHNFRDNLQDSSFNSRYTSIIASINVITCRIVYMRAKTDITTLSFSDPLPILTILYAGEIYD